MTNVQLPSLGFYVHYKHTQAGVPYNYMYEVTGIARHTETKEFMVLYRPLYKSDWFRPANFQARPLSMFMGTLERDGETVSRFVQITDPLLIAELTKAKEEMYAPHG